MYLQQLLEELSRQIAEGMGAADNVRIQVDVPHLVVQSGIAVALALFTVAMAGMTPPLVVLEELFFLVSAPLLFAEFFMACITL